MRYALHYYVYRGEIELNEKVEIFYIELKAGVGIHRFYK